MSLAHLVAEVRTELNDQEVFVPECTARKNSSVEDNCGFLALYQNNTSCPNENGIYQTKSLAIHVKTENGCHILQGLGVNKIRVLEPKRKI